MSLELNLIQKFLLSKGIVTENTQKIIDVSRDLTVESGKGGTAQKPQIVRPKEKKSATKRFGIVRRESPLD